MGDAMQMVTGSPLVLVDSRCLQSVITVLVARTSYKLIAQIFKWLTLVLFAYVITAFLAKPDWSAVLYATVVPHLEWSTRLHLGAGRASWAQPSLRTCSSGRPRRKWNASERRAGVTLAQRRGATDAELKWAGTDVRTGMFFSNLVMYFILLTTGGHTACARAEKH